MTFNRKKLMELVERLDELAAVRLRHVMTGEVNRPMHYEEFEKSAEAIRSLLSLVSEMAEAMEPAANYWQAEQEILKEHASEDDRFLAGCGKWGTRHEWINYGHLRKMHAVLQKAREATGSHEDNSQSHGAES